MPSARTLSDSSAMEAGLSLYSDRHWCSTHALSKDSARQLSHGGRPVPIQLQALMFHTRPQQGLCQTAQPRRQACLYTVTGIDVPHTPSARTLPDSSAMEAGLSLYSDRHWCSIHALSKDSARQLSHGGRPVSIQRQALMLHTHPQQGFTSGVYKSSISF